MGGKKLGEDVVREQSAVRTEREAFRMALKAEQAVGDEPMSDSKRGLSGLIAKKANEIRDGNAGVAAQAEEPELFHLLDGAKPALLGQRCGSGKVIVKAGGGGEAQRSRRRTD